MFEPSLYINIFYIYIHITYPTWPLEVGFFKSQVGFQRGIWPMRQYGEELGLRCLAAKGIQVESMILRWMFCLHRCAQGVFCLSFVCLLYPGLGNVQVEYSGWGTNLDHIPDPDMCCAFCQAWDIRQSRLRT